MEHPAPPVLVPAYPDAPPRRILLELGAAGKLPRLARFFGRTHSPWRGDCEVTSTALYLDLVRAGADDGWSLKMARLAIGAHTWCSYIDSTGTVWAVNLNLGEVRVCPEADYLAGNDADLTAVRRADRSYAARLHAASTRLAAGGATAQDLAVFARAFSEFV
jgi:hypothetical protein